jgi:two-component system, NarL family, nitrate/nitrite response regulator NarL
MLRSQTPARGTGAVSAPVRVFIVDDHALFREGLTRLLGTEHGLEVVGSVGTAEAALEQLGKLGKLEVDVLIADYDLGAANALPLIAEVKQRGHTVRMLLVTAGVPSRDAVELLKLGVSGIFQKQHPPEELLRTIREVAAGKAVFDQDYFVRLLEEAGSAKEKLKLTERERTILSLLLEGQSNKEIGNALKLSESAVKAAFQQLFARTGVRTRSQLVRIALEELRDEL